MLKNWHFLNVTKKFLNWEKKTNRYYLNFNKTNLWIKSLRKKRKFCIYNNKKSNKIQTSDSNPYPNKSCTDRHHCSAAWPLHSQMCCDDVLIPLVRKWFLLAQTYFLSIWQGQFYELYDCDKIKCDHKNYRNSMSRSPLN